MDEKQRFDNYEDRHKFLYGKKGSGKKDYAEILHLVGILHEFPFISGNINDNTERAKQDIFGYLEYSKQNNKEEFHPGLIEQAGKGTLYLHDINLLPAEVLKQLIALTYSTDKSYLPINSTERKQFDVRLILSTDLEEIDIPRDFFSPFAFNFSTPQKILPLNQQPHRIKEMANFIMNKICREKEIAPIPYTKESMDALIQYGWSGGIPEMLEKIEAAVEKAHKKYKGILESKDIICLEHLSDEIKLAHSTLTSKKKDEEKQLTKDNKLRIRFIEKDKGKWEIGFDGQSIIIKSELVGLSRIHFILQYNNNPYSPEIVINLGAALPGSSSDSAFIDDNSIQSNIIDQIEEMRYSTENIKELIEDTNLEIVDMESRINPIEDGELSEKLEQKKKLVSELKDILFKMKKAKKNNSPIKIKDKQFHNARTTVYKSIDKGLKFIAEEFDDKKLDSEEKKLNLTNYLNINNFKIGDSCYYEPLKGYDMPEWILFDKITYEK